ncbi:MAG: hypothetical protein ABIJ92_01820 [Candidatus Aenigmatarchaeota archaeon]
MKNFLLIISIFMSLSIILTQVYAIDYAPILIEPVSDSITTHSGRYVAYEFFVTNNQDTPDDLAVRISGDRLEWVISSIILMHLEPGQTKKLEIGLLPRLIDDREHTYILTMESIRSSAKETQRFHLDILEPFKITAFDSVKEGNAIKFAFSYDTSINQDVNIQMKVVDKMGNEIVSSSSSALLSETGTITKYLQLPDDALAGDYDFSVDFQPTQVGEMSSSKESFIIEEIHDVQETEQRIVTPLYEEVTVTVVNRGNVKEEGYPIYQTVRSDFLTGFLTKPSECDTSGGQTTCKYLVADLEPDEIKTVTYRVEFWPIILQFVVVIVIAIALVTYSFTRATSPTIKKYNRKKGNTKHSVVLYVKNPYRQHLKNVMIRDWVSPLAVVKNEDFYNMKPTIRKSEAGTELLWKVDNIKPKEEVIINYNINTLVEGNIKLSRATMRYFDKIGNKTEIYSNPLYIE